MGCQFIAPKYLKDLGYLDVRRLNTLRKMLPAIIFLVVLAASITTITEAFVYQMNTQTMTQRVRNSLEETLRPNGYSSSSLSVYPSGTPNWESVNDVVSARALRIGVSLRSRQASRCTQVWIVVTYIWNLWHMCMHRPGARERF